MCQKNTFLLEIKTQRAVVFEGLYGGLQMYLPEYVRGTTQMYFDKSLMIAEQYPTSRSAEVSKH